MAARTSFSSPRCRGAVFVQVPGNLVEVAADPAVLGCELPDSGKQLVIDRRHMDNGAYGRFPYGLPDKFGLADIISASRPVKSAYSSSDIRVFTT